MLFVNTAYIMYLLLTVYKLLFSVVIMNYTINTLDQLKPILVGYRKSQGLSQKELAEKLGVSQQTYQTLESNPQKVTIERLFNVLTLLGVRLSLSDVVSPSIENQQDDW